MVKSLKNLMPEMDLNAYPELREHKEEIESIKKKLQTVIYWKDLQILSREGDRISFTSDFSVESYFLQEVFKDSTKVTVACVSLGSSITRYIQEKMAGGGYYLGALADSFASHYVEYLTERWVELRQKEELSRGFYPTVRFSPGYGDFELENQQQIINLLGLEAEITVTDSFLLEPEKTITFIMGWSHKPQTKAYPVVTRNSCPGKGNCQYCTTLACESK